VAALGARLPAIEAAQVPRLQTYPDPFQRLLVAQGREQKLHGCAVTRGRRPTAPTSAGEP